MKNQVLSIEQMKHLKELGVDVSKGSMVYRLLPVCFWDTGKYYLAAIVELQEDIADIPTFTLQDILELLPNFISKDGYVYDLTSDMHNSMAYKIDWDNLEDNDLIDVNDLYLHTESDGSNLLKMAYRMFCWLAENGYLTKEEG